MGGGAESRVQSGAIIGVVADVDVQMVLNWGFQPFNSDIQIVSVTDGQPAPDNSDLTLEPLLLLLPPRPETVVPEPGDYNHNGVVDAADYTIWRDTLGSTTDLRANGDNAGASAGKIDQADYDFWKSHFGNHADSGAGATTAVPEPATLPLLLTGILTLYCRRRPKLS